MKSRLTLFLSGAIILLCCGFQCYKDAKPLPTKYFFKIDINITPLKKTYTLADTIWLEAEVNGKMLFDTISDQLITLDTLGLQARITYAQFAANPFTFNPPDGFCQVIMPGMSNIFRYQNAGNTVAGFNNYGCGSTSFRWKIGLKPNYKGTYAVLPDLGGVLLPCQSSIVSGPFQSQYKYQFATSNLNQDIYQAIPDNERKSNTSPIGGFMQGFANRTAFVIKVE